MDIFALSLYDARSRPRIRTVIDKRALRPGEIALGQNIRTDSEVMMTRMPDLVLNANAPTSATTYKLCLGAWHGGLNGTSYTVSAWKMDDGSVGVFTQNLSTGAFTELTDAGNSTHPSTWGGDANGETRFATSSGVSVGFVPCSTPRRVVQGTVVPPVDVLVIFNGEDYPIIWNPGSGLSSAAQIMWHQPITVPTGANSFTTLYTFANYWTILGTTGKTFASSASVNASGHFVLAMTAGTDLYNTSGSNTANAVLKLSIGTSTASGDIATVRFTTGTIQRGQATGGLFNANGTYLNIFFEGSASDIQYILKDTLIALGKENVAYASVSTWSTVFDGVNTDPALSTMPPLVAVDASNTRWVMQFRLQNIPLLANRAAYHIKFTRQNANKPSAAKSVLILAITSCGSGGGFPAQTAWTAVYTDHYSFAESPPVTQLAVEGDYLSNVGGPRGPDALQSTPITLPVTNTTLFYDHNLKLKNTDYNSGAQFTGGLQGQPSHIDLYFATPEQIAKNPDAKPFYFSSYALLTPELTADHVWTNLNGSTPIVTIQSQYVQSAGVTPLGFGYGDFATIDYKSQDPGVVPPSDFHISIPKSAVMAVGNGRLYAGNNKYSGGYSRSELMFSDLGFFGRFRTESDPADFVGGSKLNIEGETIKAIATCSAAAEGATTVYVFTDRSVSALGTSGGQSFMGTGFDPADIGRRQRISSDGTNNPMSVAEHNSQLIWINNRGQVVAMENGAIRHISYKQITGGTNPSGDITGAIPSARRALAIGLFAKQRYYLFCTPVSGSTNSKCAVWNDPDLSWLEDQAVMYWESIDTLTSCERAVAVVDLTQNGSGERIIVYGTDGKTYAYEEGTGTVAFELDTRDFMAEEVMEKKYSAGGSFFAKEIEIAGDADSGVTINVDCYPDSYSGSSAYRFALAMDTQSNQENLVQASVSSGTVISGRRCWFKVSGTVSGGKVFTVIRAYVQSDTVDSRKASN